MKEAFGAAGCFVIVIILLIVLPLAAWGAKVYFAEEIGRGNAEIQIESANSRIPRYDQFYNVCASVQNAESAIDSETKRLEVTTSPAEIQRINQNLSAQQITRASAINEYNALSAQYYTNARFKGYNLPDRLDTQAYEAGGQHTQCAR